MALDIKLNEVLKVNIKEFKNTKSISIDEKDINEFRTLIRENEFIRIMQELNKNNLNTGVKFPYVKDIICMDTNSRNVYRANTSGKVTINDKEFIRTLASSGDIRNTKVLFSKNEYYDKLMDILLCGLDKDMVHDCFAKYSSYLALCTTDSLPVPMPNIALIDDYEFDIEEIFDIVKETGVDEYGKAKYKVFNNKKWKKKVKPFDGAGLIDISIALSWVKKLGLDYIPSCFQFRAIPGIKGNVYVVDMAEFAERYGKDTIKTAFGKEVSFIKDNINCILTKSQFKFFAQYKKKYGIDGFEKWLEHFNTETHGYRRTFNISKVADNVDELKTKIPLSYQPLQSLNLDIDKIKLLCSDTVNIIKDISTDVDKFLQYRGLNVEFETEQEEQGKTKVFVPKFYEALRLNKGLFTDDYIYSKVKRDVQGFKERSYKGAIFCDGNYQTFTPDIAGLIQYTFGMEVKGLLGNGQVYSNYWLNQGINRVGIIRFPHIAMEWAVRDVVSPADLCIYKYITEGIVTSMFDSISLKLNGADFDNDKVASTSSPVLIQTTLEQQTNTILFLDQKKKEDGKKKEKTSYKINNMEELIRVDCKGMENNTGKNGLGSVINQITRLWSIKQSKQVQDYIKILSVIGSLVIDSVKTGIYANVPTEIEQYIQNNKIKDPAFLGWKYKKKKTKQKQSDINSYILNKDEKEKIVILDDIDCTMNRISKYMQEQVEEIEVNRPKESFNYESLMQNPKVYRYNSTYPKVKETLSQLKNEYNELTKDISRSYKKDENDDYRYRLFYEYCKYELQYICKDINKLIDYVVYAFYADGLISNGEDDLSILWNCFGEELANRLQGKEVTISIDLDTIEGELEIVKPKVRKIKNKAQIAKIDLFNDADIEIYITKDEVEYISKINDTDLRNVIFVLLAIQKMCNAYAEKYPLTNKYGTKIRNKKYDFVLYSGKPEKINRGQLRKLTNIKSHDKLNKLLKEIDNEKLINMDFKGSDSTAIKCAVPFVNDSSEIVITINNLNECKKYFAKLIKIVDSGIKVCYN